MTYLSALIILSVSARRFGDLLIFSENSSHRSGLWLSVSVLDNNNCLCSLRLLRPTPRCSLPQWVARQITSTDCSLSLSLLQRCLPLPLLTLAKLLVLQPGRTPSLRSSLLLIHSFTRSAPPWRGLPEPSVMMRSPTPSKSPSPAHHCAPPATRNHAGAITTCGRSFARAGG